MELPEIGSSVIYLSRKSADGETTAQEVTVIGYDPLPPDSEAKLPPAHLAFVHPDRISQLGGADWRTAFDRVMSVPHVSDESAKRHCYELRVKEVEPGQEVAKEDDVKAAAKPLETDPVDAFEKQKAESGKPYLAHDGKLYQIKKGELLDVDVKAK